MVAAVIQQGLLLLGTSSTQFSQLRQAKALAKLNPDLKSMAEYCRLTKKADPAPLYPSHLTVVLTSLIYSFYCIDGILVRSMLQKLNSAAGTLGIDTSHWVPLSLMSFVNRFC